MTMKHSRIEPWGGMKACNETSDCFSINSNGDVMARSRCFEAGDDLKSRWNVSSSFCGCNLWEGGFTGKDCAEWTGVSILHTVLYGTCIIVSLWFIWMAVGISYKSLNKDKQSKRRRTCSLLQSSAGVSLLMATFAQVILLGESIGRLEQYGVKGHVNFRAREDALDVLYRISVVLTGTTLFQVSFTWLASVRSTRTVSSERINVLRKAASMGIVCFIVMMIIGFFYYSFLSWIYVAGITVVGCTYVYGGYRLSHLIKKVLRLSSTVAEHKEWMKLTLALVQRSCLELVGISVLGLFTSIMGGIFLISPIAAIESENAQDYLAQLSRGGATLLLLVASGVVIRFVNESKKLEEISPRGSKTSALSSDQQRMDRSMLALHNSEHGKLFTIMSQGDEEEDAETFEVMTGSGLNSQTSFGQSFS